MKLSNRQLKCASEHQISATGFTIEYDIRAGQHVRQSIGVPNRLLNHGFANQRIEILYNNPDPTRLHPGPTTIAGALVIPLSALSITRSTDRQ